MFRKTIFLFENIIYWYIGLAIATLIFAISTFYVAPLATGLKIDSDKYIATTYKNIYQTQQNAIIERINAEQIEQIEQTEQKPSFFSELYKQFDTATDNIIKWINKKEEK